MFLLGPGRVVVSPTDLRLASECEFALLRGLDVRLGRSPAVALPPDPMLDRVAGLGRAHEQAELLRLRGLHPAEGAVVGFGLPGHTDTALAAARDATLSALEDPGVRVVHQGTVYDGDFVGHVDFIERVPGGWRISDTKLSRDASVPALLQVAAYADLLRSAGVDISPVVRLVLGKGVTEDFRVDEIVPVYRARRRRLEAVVAAHLAAGEPVAWGAEGVVACGRCDLCEPEAEAAHDLIWVAGVRAPTRRRLIGAGVLTADDLARRTEPVDEVRETMLDRLREQARIQLEGLAGGVGRDDPAGADDDSPRPVLHEVVDPGPLQRLPHPSPGDVFFDFEADPLWVEPGEPARGGLEYLFGMVEVDGLPGAGATGEGEPRFRSFWAHDRAEEKQALVDFVTYLKQRRQQWPDLHVYHYADYEKSALLRLAARHGVCEDDIDQFLRQGVFIDLYAAARTALRISERSMSLKVLEHLYRGVRSGEVTGGEASIVTYHEFVLAREMGQHDVARAKLAEIAAYNTDDCVSTWQLRNWLRDEGIRWPAGDDPATGDIAHVVPPPSAQRVELLDVESRLDALVADVRRADRTPDEAVIALASAAVLFHAREDKPTWQRYFERLRLPITDWRGGDEAVFVVTHAEVVSDWARTTPNQRKPRRLLRLGGEPLSGQPIPAGLRMRPVYTAPTPPGVELSEGAIHGASTGGLHVVAVESESIRRGWLHQFLLVEELPPTNEGGHSQLPSALVELNVVGTRSIDEALAELGREILERQPELPTRAATDLLARRPPRLGDGGALPPIGDGPDRHVDAMVAALLGMTDSYLAVQGPPGTGKTYVGGRAIAQLVTEHGWKVGVCSQSHKAIENVLHSVIAAGVPAARVGKATRETDDPPWTDLASTNALADFATEHPEGYVIGGTVWNLTNPKQVARGQLDLVVIDEAGQYSLAKTMAASVAGDRLLLLGDPAQLPQVSRGTHPEPVDSSALGWLLPTDPGAGRTLPATHGYFLDRTWRLHPRLAARVSDLSYDGELAAEPGIAEVRSLEGLAPGLHVRLVDHTDNSTASVEEADEVVRIARDLIGRTWHDPQERGADGVPAEPRPLEQGDLIVITPYNHQVHTIREALDEARLTSVPVGTVDKFQGQEAAVAIVSFAASSPTSISRGIGFILNRNRLNVAVSRGKWAAIMVRSPVLTDFAPRSTNELVTLGAFLNLCGHAVTTLAAEPAVAVQ